MRLLYILAVLCLTSALTCASVYADSIAIIKQGLLGAGTGAVASAMSGGKGDRVWQGALAGAGVMVVGGALLDMLTGERTGTIAYASQPQPVTYVRQVRPITVIQPAKNYRQGPVYRRVYREGFRDGYGQGYRDGYEDASRAIYMY